MKALLSLAAGGPETLVLREVAEPPQPGNEEILLRVKSCAVNYPDVLIIEDKYQIKPPRPLKWSARAFEI
jgi:NADPH:quinone reductase